MCLTQFKWNQIWLLNITHVNFQHFQFMKGLAKAGPFLLPFLVAEVRHERFAAP